MGRSRGRGCDPELEMLEVERDEPRMFLRPPPRMGFLGFASA